MKLIAFTVTCCFAAPLFLLLSSAATGADAHADSHSDAHSDPYSDHDQWVPSEREIATITRKDRRILQAAVEQYTSEFHMTKGDAITYEDIKVYLRSDSRLYRSHGKDILGNAFKFSTIGAGVMISPATMQELRSISREFWTAVP
jgi:hypothetical protein